VQTLSVGRIVHVYSSRWSGPRPGIIVGVERLAAGESEPRANVNVFLDGTRDAEILQLFRLRSTGNTIASMLINSPANSDDRIQALRENQPSNNGGVFWAEWPPVAPIPLPPLATRAAQNGHAPELRPNPAVQSSDATGGEPAGPAAETKPDEGDDGN